MDWLKVNESQLLNILTFGKRGEMLCARAHRRRWWVRKLIGQRHCKAVYVWQQRHNGE